MVIITRAPKQWLAVSHHCWALHNMADNQSVHPFPFGSLFCLCFQKFICNIYNFITRECEWLYVHPLLTGISNSAYQHTLHVIRCWTNWLTIKTEQHVSTKVQKDCRKNSTSHKHAIQCCSSSSEASFNTSYPHSIGHTGLEQWHKQMSGKLVLSWRVKTQKHAAIILWIVRYVSGPHNMFTQVHSACQ
jgi:hypothetical protein